MSNFSLKQFLLALVVLVLGASNNYAQDENVPKNEVKYIVFDYLVDAPQSYSKQVNFGTLLGIKIKNVNKKLIQINNSFTGTSLHTTTPEAFQVFSKTKIPQETSSEETAAGFDFQPSYFTSDEIEAANGLGVTELEQIEGKYSSLYENLDYLDKRIGAFLADYYYIKNLTSYHRDILLISNLCNRSFSDINMAFITRTKNLLTSDQANVSDVLENSDVIEANKGDVIMNRLILENYSLEVLENAEASYDNLIQYFSTAHLNKLEAEIDELQEQAAKMLNYVADHSLAKDKPGIIPKLKELATFNAFNNRLSSIIKFYDSFNFSKLYENLTIFKDTGLEAMFRDYDYFNEANYTYYTPLQTIDEDLATFTIDLTSKEENTCPIIPKRYEVKIRVKKGLKIDFSTGLLLNFGGNDFIDQTYGYRSITESDSVQITKNANKNFLFPSLGALMHIYTRNGTNFQPSLSFGISTEELSKLNYHFGGSIILGFSQRVVISAGLTLRQTLLLEDRYEVGQLLPKATAPESIPTSNFYRIGFFSSFTYNLN